MLEDLFVDSVRPRRFQSWLFGSFATAGLVVVGVGMLGLLAMSTARRTREIGIRMALGATADRVIRWLVVEQLTEVVAGLAGGALVSLWTVRFLKQYLYEIGASDARVCLRTS